VTDLHCCIRVPYAKRIISRCTCFRIFADWSSEVEKEAQEIKAVLTLALPLLSVLLLRIFKIFVLMGCGGGGGGCFIATVAK
jgi:hypothetical protein